MKSIASKFSSKLRKFWGQALQNAEKSRFLQCLSPTSSKLQTQAVHNGSAEEDDEALMIVAPDTEDAGTGEVVVVDELRA